MTCTYLGDDVRNYPQYLDADTGLPLTAAPGGSYEITPAGGLDRPVPPDDGRWEAPEAPADDVTDQDEGDEGPGLPLPPLMTGSSTEGEEN